LDKWDSAAEVYLVCDNPAFDATFINYYLDMANLPQILYRRDSTNGKLSYRSVHDADLYGRGYFKQGIDQVWFSNADAAKEWGASADGQFWHFMQPESFEQFAAGETAVGEAAQWLKDGTVCIVTLWNGQPLGITPPPHVELKIVETDPGMRGDTVTGGTKIAKLETGATVKVPLFVNQGEVVRVDTRTGSYISRVK
jgi:translation elongation factor P/translation initiation factor 5A